MSTVDTPSDVLEELRRKAGLFDLLTAETATFDEMEAHVRKTGGVSSFTASTLASHEESPSGAAATRMLAYLMIETLLDNDGDLPPNYLSTPLEFYASVKPGGEFREVRASIEVVRPGRKSSHEIREILTARLEEAGLSASVD